MHNSNFGEGVLSNYSKVENNVIGKGAYGIVCKAIENRTKQYVALKKIIIEMSQGIPSTSIREISLLREIQHKNVVALKDVIIDKDLYLVFEYLEKDLKTYMESLGQKQMDPAKVKKFLYQMLTGIAQCHMKRILHRDLKPANILLDKNQNLKIADFGLARTFSIPVRPYSQEVVTLWYRAPEVLLGSNEYSTPIDIWSIGCIFAEMVTKRPLFSGDSQIDLICRIFRILGTPNQETWPGVTKLRDYKSTFPNYPPNKIQNVVSSLNLDPYGLDLLTKMLRYDPNTRITAKAALQHPYFKDYKEF